jgi:hypothetical protein
MKWLKSIGNSALENDGAAKVSSGGKFVVATFARPADTTAYTAGDNVSTITTAGSAFVFSGTLFPGDQRAIVITDAILSIDLTGVPAGMAGFTVYFFNAAKTRDDNAPAALSYADMSDCLGSIEFSTPVDLGGVLVSQAKSENLELVGASGADDIYTVVVTNGTYTPAASTGFKLALKTANL